MKCHELISLEGTGSGQANFGQWGIKQKKG